MLACLRQLGVMALLGLAEAGQVLGADAPGVVRATTNPADDGPEAQVVAADQVEVFLRPDEASFGIATLERGDSVRVRRSRQDGWAEIEPPRGAIGWVERSAVAIEEQEGSQPAADGGGRTPGRARVAERGVMVRAGHLGARMPGPAWLGLPAGASVRLVDLPPLRTGRGRSATTWLAIVPPAGASGHVRAEALGPPPRRPATSEMLASYLVPQGEPDRPAKKDDALPPDARAEIDRLDRMHRSILVDQPVDRWNLQPVRAGYQELLTRWHDQPAIEEALRTRLARVTQHEQASAAAREFQAVLARSRQRDAQVALLDRRLAELDRKRTVSYAAVGTVQPSVRMLNGHQLHVLVGKQGQTIAYLDMPPGLDVEALGTKRVGVRGTIHYRQDLGTRLITVRDVETVGTRR
ncbi:MAG: SH3 domain-containing protein [Isosphaeraceae bacterium]